MNLLIATGIGLALFVAIGSACAAVVMAETWLKIPIPTMLVGTALSGCILFVVIVVLGAIMTVFVP